MEGGTIGWTETSLVCRPEPSVDVLWEEVRPVATVKVTETTGGPEVRNIAFGGSSVVTLSSQLTIDESLHPIVFLLGFKRNKIHATLPENIEIVNFWRLYDLSCTCSSSWR